MKDTVKFATLLVVLLTLTVQQASAYYDPSVQRWINRDPLGEFGSEITRIGRVPAQVSRTGEVNPYLFLNNSPLRYIDAFGLDAGVISIPSIAVGGSATVGGAICSGAAIGITIGIVLDRCTPVGRIGERLANRFCPPKEWVPITCWLSPVLSDDVTRCTYVCPGTHGGHAGGSNVVVRKPGPNGCADTIRIMWPKE